MIDFTKAFSPGMRICFSFLPVIFCCQLLWSQTIKGKVISDDTKKPLPSVSVYINNTSLGTITNGRGEFIINKIPQGKNNLVVTSVGYEAFVKLIDPRVIEHRYQSQTSWYFRPYNVPEVLQSRQTE